MIFGTCNTLPAAEVSQFEHAYQTALKPFLTTFYNSSLSATLYYSGKLLEWLTKEHPEFHSVLTELSENKIVEILGGPYWEPLLPLIPSSDRVSQIEKLTTDIRQKFGKRPRGIWLAANVWESSLAASLATCGMGFVFLSSRNLPSMMDNSAPMITEDQGKPIVVFSNNESLTGKFVKVPPEQIIDSLKKIGESDEEETLVSLIVDGMVFANDGILWLERFCEVVKDNSNWLKCIQPADYLKNFHYPKKRIYLPTPSYRYFMEWIENSDAYSDTSSYRDFLLHYRESSLLYSKMMHTNVLSNQVRNDKYRKKNAKEEIWKGQEHYAYWYGPKGGIYNPHLRNHAYKALIESEKITRERGIFKPALTSVDFDMDGEKEFLYSGTMYNAYVHLVGAALFELDYLPDSHNYIATLASYPESCPGEKHDRFPRHAFMDFVLRPEDDLQLYRQSNSFAGRVYSQQDMNREHPDVRFTVLGPVNNIEDALQIDKVYEFNENGFHVGYSLANNSHGRLEFLFASEINLALPEDCNNRKIFLNTDRIGDSPISDKGLDGGVVSWLVEDKERQVCIHVTLSEPGSLWRYPLSIDYRIENQLCNGYQGSTFLPYWSVNLSPLETQHFGITLRWLANSD